MISLLVEGKGDKSAGPQLVRRLLHFLMDEFTIHVASQAIAARGKPDLLKRFDNYIRSLCNDERCQGIVVLVDADSDLPVNLARGLAVRAQGCSRVSVVVVCPVQEFENWFVCSFENFCQQLDATLSERLAADCEHATDPKRLLDRCLEDGYRSRLDQSKLVHQINLDLAFERSPSFRRLGQALGELVGAIQSGTPVFTP